MSTARRSRVARTHLKVRHLHVFPSFKRTAFRERSPGDTFIAAADIGDSLLCPTLLTGRGLARSDSDITLKLFVLPLTEDEMEIVAQTDEAGDPVPSVRVKAALALWQAGLRLDQIPSALGLEMKKSAIHRLVTAGKRLTPYSLKMLDAGSITWGHTRHLVLLDPEAQDYWAGKVVSQSKSPAALGNEIAGRPSPADTDADLQKFTKDLQSKLKTDDLRLVSRGEHGYRLEIRWSTIPVLQQALVTLCNTDKDHAPVSRTRARTTVIEIDSLEEMDQLTDHLKED